MTNKVKIVFRTQPVEKTVPTLVLGQLSNLVAVPFKTVIEKQFSYAVSEELWLKGLASLSPGESCPLILRNSVSALPTRCSRHCAPARPAYISRVVKQLSRKEDHAILVVCEKKDLLATVCAIGRTYPVYSRYSKRSQGTNSEETKNGSSNEEVTVYVSIHLVSSQQPNSTGSPDEVPWQAPTGILANTTLSEEELKTLEDTVESVRLVARLVDTPTNEMNVDHFLKEITAVGQEFKIKPKIIRGEELNEQGFGGLYGVGKAAAVPPALAILSWTPEGATETIAWVGKGIVFDTGGLSMKSKTAMPGMKRDCGGAAGILGAFQNVVRSGFTQNLHAIFCLAENSVGPKATRPDDVHILYSGRSVEINNTDAEGRLVLADGVAYAQKDLKADVILDMATLTGAQGIALGKHHAAVLSNSADWESATCASGRNSGDLAFPVPYAPELHISEYASAVADMTNSVADRSNAQVSCAGLFIGAQLGWDFSGIWIHIDMTYPSYSGERATGYGVALLSVLFGDRTKRGLFKALAPNVKTPISASPSSAKKSRHH